MRIIAGSAGGIPLSLPRHELRPTMDKVKGAIFSSLGERVAGAVVLDLFAGSGALGIEALSRGAATARFVDSHAQSIASIQANLQKARLSGEVTRDEVFRWLKRNVESFDLIFADPPYAKIRADQDFAGELLHSADLARALTPDGLFILEMAPGSAELPGEYFDPVRRKTYGATEVVILQKRQSLSA